MKAQQFPFIAQGRGIEIQSFSLVVRTTLSIASLAVKIDPGTAGASVYTLNFPPADKNGFYSVQQDGGLALAFDAAQPWMIQIGTKPGQFNTLRDGDVLECYLLMEYTLQ